MRSIVHCVKRLVVISTLILLSFACAYFSEVLDAPLKVKVKNDFYHVSEVVDGDTFWVQQQDGQTFKVRLIGIDAPETKNVFNKRKHPFGEISKKYLDDLLKTNPFVRLQFDIDSLDQYGRTLAYVYLGSTNIMLNELLIEEGYAILMTIPPNVMFEKRFTDAQEKAKANQAGIWNVSMMQ